MSGEADSSCPDDLRFFLAVDAEILYYSGAMIWHLNTEHYATLQIAERARP